MHHSTAIGRRIFQGLANGRKVDFELLIANAKAKATVSESLVERSEALCNQRFCRVDTFEEWVFVANPGL